VLLTLLGAAGEALGYDRMLKTNAVKRRVQLVVPPGLHALLFNPDNAGDQAAPADAALFPSCCKTPLFTDVFRSV